MAILNMANAADTEKIRQIDKGIENAQRFEDVLASGEFSEEEQGKLISVPDEQFVQILKERGFGDIIGLKDARRDYFLYKDTKTSQPPQAETEEEQGERLNPAEAAGVLLALGMTPFMRSGLTPEMLETSSKDYAEKAAIEWNKTKDYSKAKSYFHAFEIAQQDYFDRFAYTDPKTAKKLANFQTQKFVQRALLRNRLLKEEGVKGFVARSFAPNYEQVAENRLRMIDKLAEMRASEVSTKDEEREKLLRNFADDDPVTFQHHINQQREQDKRLDPLMVKVIDEKIRDEQRLAERNKLSQKRREERQQAAPAPASQPAKKSGRISRIKTRVKNRISSSKLGQKFQSSRLGKAISAPSRFKNQIKQRLASSKLGRLGKKLNNLRPGNVAGRLRKKLKNSILNLLTKLLKRSLIGAVISAISSLISTAIAFAITIGTAIAAILATVLSLLTGAIAALLSVTIATLASILATVIVVSLFVIVVFTVLSVLQQYFPDPAPGISYGIWGPERVKNGENIKNRVGFFYFSNASCSIDDIVLVDTLPSASTFVSATGKYEKGVDPNVPGGTIKWKIKENSPTLPRVGNGADQYVFEVEHKPQDNIIATSKVSMEGCKLPVKTYGCEYDPNDLTCGAEDAPSTLKCDGTDGSLEVTDSTYDVLTLSGKLKRTDANFGDPKCSFSRAKLEKLIEQEEPVVENRTSWMRITVCISPGMGPNLYPEKAGNSEKDKNGWGLFGMKRRADVNNYFDQTERDSPERGDVPWQKQVQNAINYNNTHGGNFNLKRWQKCLK